MKKIILTSLSMLAFMATLWVACSEKKPLTRCEMYEIALNGDYRSPYMDGIMSFEGGMEGTVDISGVDFNDIVCTYRILDCDTGQADMNCQGRPHQDIILMINTDSIKVGNNHYSRVPKS